MENHSPRKSPWVQSELLTHAGFRHAFFTRVGGSSSAPFESLNFSASVGDGAENVAANFGLAGNALGIKREQVCHLSQVHGARVVILTDPAATRDQTMAIEGDALASDRPELACGVRTADCIPLLLASPDTGWVAAVHAGWRGCVAGVAVEAVRALREQGAGRLLAAIGPHISRDAFEVSREVADELRAASPDKDIVDDSRAKPHVDLRRMISSQLKAEGVRAEDIDQVQGCTYLEPELYYSFRRDGPVSGRHLSAIVPRGR